MLLELATSFGAITGAFVAVYLNPRVLFFLFGFIILFSILPTIKKLGEDIPAGVTDDALSARLRLASYYPDRKSQSLDPVPGDARAARLRYDVHRGGRLGPAGHRLRRAQSAGDGHRDAPAAEGLDATSNFMIGVTAAASAGIYFWRGDVEPLIAAPIALGVLAGATIGAKLLVNFKNKTVRLIFLPVLGIVAIEMLLRGLGIG